MGTNELIAEVIAYHADDYLTHYDGCYQRHAGCLAVMLRDMLREHSVPDAATEAKQPEGWSTKDRQESKHEAERRWSRPVAREAEQRYQAGSINGFMLGAEWQKARETFISYKAIADEAKASIAEAAKLHRRDSPGLGGEWCQSDGLKWPCPTAVALGLNEREHDD